MDSTTDTSNARNSKKRSGGNFQICNTRNIHNDHHNHRQKHHDEVDSKNGNKI